MNVAMNPNGQLTKQIDEAVPEGGTRKIEIQMTEEEADKMIVDQFEKDPAKLRAYAEAMFAKINSLADNLDGGNYDREDPDANDNNSSESEMTASEKTTVINQTNGVVDNRLDKVVKVDTRLEEKRKPSTVNHEVIVKQSNNQASQIETKEEKPQIEQPTGYMDLPEGLYVWSPESWGGRPLRLIPDTVLEREGRPTLIFCVLVAPAFARNRQGKVVNLPEGGRVIIHSNIAWNPIIPLVKGPKGRPILWICPTTMDEITKKIRIAQPGEKLYKFETGDGGFEYGLKIAYDPDPKDPTTPKLIDLETLRGKK